MSARQPAFAAAGLRQRPEQHRIVIVGGGAGGLELAARLGDKLGKHRQQAEVLLVDASLTHVWKPSLHEMAAGTLAGNDAEVEFLQQARRHGFRFHLGSLESLDRKSREVWLAPLFDDEGRQLAPRRAIAYDTLVIAVGSVVNDFGTPGVQRYAVALNSAPDAQRFHRRLLAECARAELQNDGPVQIAIVGGGATGVELAAELVESVSEIASYGARLQQFDRPVRLRLIEAGQRLLAALPEDVAAQAREDLEARGVEILTGRRVTEVAGDHVSLDNGERLPSAITVWAAGIQGPAVLERLDGLELNKLRQLVVRNTLQTTQDEDIFAMGDCASCVPEPGSAPVPPRAQAAHQEARYLAGVLLRRLRNQQPAHGFAFHDRGSLVSLGSRDAVGKILGPGHGVRLQGLIARLTYWAVQRQHMVTLHGWFRAALATVSAWLGGRSRPRVKLH